MPESHKQIWSSRISVEPSKENILYCSGRDVSEKPMADAVLIPYDVWNNEAHSIMLYHQKILSRDKLAEILKALQKLKRLYNASHFKLNPEYEDVHINIEKFVTEEVGADTGGWMHTARSRNDQTTTDIRLYMRDFILDFSKDIIKFVNVLLKVAGEHTYTVMPGFTHYQPAAITTYGHWLTSYIEAIIRDLYRLLFAYNVINKNPLGAAAAFGTSWNIDRNLTTEYLGFDAIQGNALDCITSRWEMESQAACAVSFFMTHLSIISQDILFLSSSPYAMIRIDDRYITGSSIMPQKRNPDFAEVTKAKTTVVTSLSNSLWGIAKSSLSGYNRDSQWTKYIIMDIFDEVYLAPRIYTNVFDTLKVDTERMLEFSKQNFINANVIADYIASTRKMPFRLIYNVVAKAVKASEKTGSLTLKSVNKMLRKVEGAEILSQVEWKKLFDPLKMIGQKNHIGGPAPETVARHIESLSKEIKTIEKKFNQKKANIQTAQKKLNAFIKKIIESSQPQKKEVKKQEIKKPVSLKLEAIKDNIKKSNLKNTASQNMEKEK